ncbi:MAG: 2-amino-4-hydroxy-6-hydroxymethyldihydropteridine diphosphokinase [Staphylococcus sp.]|nr:2-amino-4-hydroxy-6-hydroxymethyldihydropteridine diphosphokinase [Staphylococcus sp.]
MDLNTTLDIHINIGSNSGHREAFIELAVAAVSSVWAGCEVECSEVVETPPWGFDSPNPFLNVGVLVRVPRGRWDSGATREMIALAVLGQLLEIQRSIDPSPHRGADGSYIDRNIDIDLIAIADWVVETPALTLPHPRMHLREFVLQPMVQLDAAWCHPLYGKRVGEMLAEC